MDKEQIAVIDQEIASVRDAYMRTLAALNYRRNSFLPISRLPPEILAKILLEYAQMTSVHSRWYNSDPFPDIISVTQVCRQWREVALSTAQLWTTLCASLMKHETLQLFITRSQQAPLAIAVCGRGSDVEQCTEALRLVVSDISRARELILEIYQEAYAPFNNKFPQSAPGLRILRMWAFPRPSGSDDLALLPSFVTQSFAPGLTALDIVYYRVPWNASVFARSLRFLEVDYPEYMETITNYRTPLSLVAAIISELSLLEVLTLRNVLASLPYPQESSFARVEDPAPLTKLRYLFLYGYTLPIFHFLDFFQLPSCMDIELICRDACAGVVASALASSLALKVATNVGHVAHTIEALKMSPGYLTITTQRLEVASGTQLDSSHVHIADTQDHELLWDLVSRLPLDGLDEFAVDDGYHLASHPWIDDPESWTRLLSSIGNVEKLILTDYEEPVLAGMLGTLTACSPDAPHQLHLSKVKSIHLNSCNFRKSGVLEHPSQVIQHLVEMLEKRSKAGAKIEKITIDRGSKRT